MKQAYYLKQWTNNLLAISSLLVSLNIYNLPATSALDEGVNNHQSTPKKIVFILNGLWRDIAFLDSMIEKLLNAFEAEQLPVEIRRLPEEVKMTSNKSITQQANDAFEEMKRQLAKSEYEIILIGHSQGGLRGAKILFLNETQGKPLNIKGLVTLSAPWEGVPAATINKDLVRSFLNKSMLSAVIKFIHPFIDRIFDQNFPTHELGVQDMVPGSKFLQELTASLVGNAIPILAIGATSRNLEQVLPIRSNQEKVCLCYTRRLLLGVSNRLYAWIFTTSAHTHHDMMVTLYSQIAQNTTKSPAFETYIVNGAVHDFLRVPSVPAESVIYNHPEVISQIVAFAKSKFIWAY